MIQADFVIQKNIFIHISATDCIAVAIKIGPDGRREAAFPLQNN
jgi:hypothetical protein